MNLRGALEEGESALIHSPKDPPLPPKGPKCVFWQHRDFGQLNTNGVCFFFEIFT